MNSSFSSGSRVTSEPWKSDSQHLSLPLVVEMPSLPIASDNVSWQNDIMDVEYEQPRITSPQKHLGLNGVQSGSIAPLTPEEREAAIELLRSWREEDEYDEEEQQTTWEYLKQALDEDRLSERKLFP